MKKVIMLPNPHKDTNLSMTEKVVEKLNALGVKSYLDNKYANYNLSGVEFYTTLPTDADIMIVVGGDGSIIDASPLATELGIPVLGINLGKVGYLTEVDPDQLDLLERIPRGDYKVSSKMLLSATKHTTDGSCINFERFAVNDIIISHENYLGLSDMRIENDRGDQVSYRADSIILSTPQGSTAYALSAGGPIVSHTIDCITVTPVCPHSFFNRSIIYGSEEKLRITNISSQPLKISIDGRLVDILLPSECCIVSKSERRLKMVAFEESNLFSTLSKKIRHLQDLV